MKTLSWVGFSQLVYENVIKLRKPFVGYNKRVFHISFWDVYTAKNGIDIIFTKEDAFLNFFKFKKDEIPENLYFGFTFDDARSGSSMPAVSSKVASISDNIEHKRFLESLDV